MNETPYYLIIEYRPTLIYKIKMFLLSLFRKQRIVIFCPAFYDDKNFKKEKRISIQNKILFISLKKNEKYYPVSYLYNRPIQIGKITIKSNNHRVYKSFVVECRKSDKKAYNLSYKNEIAASLLESFPMDLHTRFSIYYTYRKFIMQVWLYEMTDINL